ncbi:MAG: hypothetical protein A4E53_02060 [Pelotomaculum sp. PtaB.Bin104]|nr:MAG: hypothetical protein A4E53_02060 [Pelotomaculum sp. PtaB.Bin104]
MPNSGLVQIDYQKDLKTVKSTQACCNAHKSNLRHFYSRFIPGEILKYLTGNSVSCLYSILKQDPSELVYMMLFTASSSFTLSLRLVGSVISYRQLTLTLCRAVYSIYH